MKTKSVYLKEANKVNQWFNLGWWIWLLVETQFVIGFLFTYDLMRIDLQQINEFDFYLWNNGMSSTLLFFVHEHNTGNLHSVSHSVRFLTWTAKVCLSVKLISPGGSQHHVLHLWVMMRCEFGLWGGFYLYFYCASGSVGFNTHSKDDKCESVLLSVWSFEPQLWVSNFFNNFNNAIMT